ncbi:MAG: hypothetical protein OXI87_24260 [Albidovulum sp.]|nr:hypothetical protein [Albidovulum sp.]MDE0530756.1 hypothetical protein [Albidovulum sp.]
MALRETSAAELPGLEGDERALSRKTLYRIADRLQKASEPLQAALFRRGAGADIASRRRRAWTSPLEARWTPSPAARIQQNLRKCRDRVESDLKIMHMIQEVAGRHFAKLPTWAMGERRKNGRCGRVSRIALYAVDLPIPTYFAALAADVPLFTSSCRAQTVSA